MNAIVGEVMTTTSQVMESPEAREILARALSLAVREIPNIKRGKCRLASRVVRRVPLLGLAVEADELADHALARQRNNRAPELPPVFGYTHRTMDPAYGDPRYGSFTMHNQAGEPICALISASQTDAQGSVELLVVSPYPDDPDVVSATKRAALSLAITVDARVCVFQHVTHEAGFFAKCKWTPPGCSHGPCDECGHPIVSLWSSP